MPKTVISCILALLASAFAAPIQSGIVDLGYARYQGSVNQTTGFVGQSIQAICS